MIAPSSPLLQSFEDLGSLSKDQGLYEIKPFRDWKGSSWSHKIFKMRLCNTGEILDITTLCSDLPETARVQATKIELLIRSIFAIDGKELLAAEDLQKYNESSKSPVTRIEYLRLWARNLEQVIVDRLDMIYGYLQMRQLRMLRSTSMCAVCLQEFTEIPEGSNFLKYSFADIVCNNCMPKIEVKDLDFIEQEQKKEEKVNEDVTIIQSKVSSFDFPGYVCEKCGKEVETVEEFTAHRETCPKTTG